jgi:hypothetical protein
MRLEKFRWVTTSRADNGSPRNGIHFCKIQTRSSCCSLVPTIITAVDRTRESARRPTTAVTSRDGAKAAVRPSKGRKCKGCAEPMTVSVTVQRLGCLPEIQAFRCEVCRNVTMLVDGREEGSADFSSAVRGVRLYWPSR